jgi:mRNA-degrading endonuclease toxin of MazEF toxin-antitoxin module
VLVHRVCNSATTFKLDKAHKRDLDLQGRMMAVVVQVDHWMCNGSKCSFVPICQKHRVFTLLLCALLLAMLTIY